MAKTQSITEDINLNEYFKGRKSIFQFDANTFNGEAIQNARGKTLLEKVDLDWTVSLKPLYQIHRGICKDYMVNVRDTDNLVLGVVPKSFIPLQNKEVFDILRIIMSQESKVKIESAGSVRCATDVFFLAKLNDVDILNDKVSPYFLLVNRHDGKGGNQLQLTITPVRVVCQNTLNMAMKKANNIINLPVGTDIYSHVKEHLMLYSHIKNYMIMLEAEAQQLVSINITDLQLNEILDKMLNSIVLKDNEKAYVKAEILAIYYNAPDLQDYKNTLWSLLNAVSDFATHSKFHRVSANWQEQIFIDTIFGNYYITSAYAEITNFIKEKSAININNKAYTYA